MANLTFCPPLDTFERLLATAREHKLSIPSVLHAAGLLLAVDALPEHPLPWRRRDRPKGPKPVTFSPGSVVSHACLVKFAEEYANGNKAAALDWMLRQGEHAPLALAPHYYALTLEEQVELERQARAWLGKDFQQRANPRSRVNNKARRGTRSDHPWPVDLTLSAYSTLRSAEVATGVKREEILRWAILATVLDPPPALPEGAQYVSPEPAHKRIQQFDSGVVVRRAVEYLADTHFAGSIVSTIDYVLRQRIQAAVQYANSTGDRKEALRARVLNLLP